MRRRGFLGWLGLGAASVVVGLPKLPSMVGTGMDLASGPDITAIYWVKDGVVEADQIAAGDLFFSKDGKVFVFGADGWFDPHVHDFQGLVAPRYSKDLLDPKRSV